mmetsp:Transcript_42778/g.97305  ORF Transcript_42778/g.97305 Transcript_42778/m.97305 type:complete len:88 (-) Transcript_42778:271-534(-)
MVFAILANAQDAAMARLVPAAVGEHGMEAQGLDMNVKGLPKWMLFKTPVDAVSKAQQAKIVKGGNKEYANAKRSCEQNKALGARCIF